MINPDEMWRCHLNCVYVYDPVHGDKSGKIPQGTKFEDLPPGWTCPVCGADKTIFKRMTDVN